MCGRVNVADNQSIASVLEELGADISMRGAAPVDTEMSPYYRPLLSVFVNKQGQTDSAYMNWGWQRDWDKTKRLFNARKINRRGQSIWHSPVWGEAISQRRCLIPVNAFYEWDQNQTKGNRDRYRIHTHSPAFTLGGLYEINHDGEMCLSVCTTEPNKTLAKIHHRMPVIIDTCHAQQWLVNNDQQAIDGLMQAQADDYVVMHKETRPGQSGSLF